MRKLFWAMSRAANRLVIEENKAVQLYVDEKFKVEARLPFSGKKHLIDKIPFKEYCEHDFHWSDAFYDDESGNEFVSAIGNVDDEASDNDEGNGGKEGVETRGYLSDYQKNSDNFMRGLVRIRMRM
ncbi:hypothetical protein Pint_18453 [Pistacia integerrima]|uniref:Uncharacterized protein n=1 Tax=Pistacia integerrima TaxID=434235 RepID=A0ACC0YWW6_9ROSI|nr:hypothetical protein Pint_18453 [Pistacia integerrima]